MGRLRAGAARADMTPPAGTPLAGFWAPRPAEGVDTPLAAHALVLDDGATCLAFVGLDLIALPAEHADQAKGRIRDQTGISPECVLIACSHTHEAPYPCPLLGRQTGADPAYLARVVDAAVASVARASEGMAPAEVGFASGRVGGVCQNRRRLKTPDDAFNVWTLPPPQRDSFPPAGPVDEELLVLAVRSAVGRPVAVLWNFALHAHAFAAPRVSADYPYYVWRDLAEALGGDVTCVFTAGACGDVNCRRQARPAEIVRRISEELLGLYRGMSFASRTVLGAAVSPMEVALRDFATFQEQEIRRKQPQALEVCREEWQTLRALDERSVRTAVQAMAVGDFALAAVPGEFFCALGLDVKARSPFAATAVAELSNDYVGYVPTSAAYDQGGYELFNARSSKVARGTGERMADELAGLLAGLHAAGGKEPKR